MKTLERIITEYWNLIKGMFVILTVIGTFFAIDGYLDSKIDERINNKEYVSKISRSLRPFQIFNEKGITTYDHGAEEYIVEKTVDIDKNEIIIKLSQYFQKEPLLQIIGASRYSISTERLKNNVIKYKLSDYNTLVDGSSGPISPNIYVIEILK